MKAAPSPQELKDTIVYLLGIYPVLSPSLLQLALGPTLTSESWKPLLSGLIDGGTVKRETLDTRAPNGRFRSHVLLSLNTEATLKKPRAKAA